MSSPYRPPEVDSETEEAAARAEQDRGRVLLLVILAVAIVDVPLALVYAPSLAIAYKAIPLLVVSYFLYRGRHWAKLVLLVWLGCVVLADLWLLTKSANNPSASRWGIAYVVAYGVAHAAGLVMLSSSGSIAYFLRQQRLARTNRESTSLSLDEDQDDD